MVGVVDPLIHFMLLEERKDLEVDDDVDGFFKRGKVVLVRVLIIALPFITHL